MDDKLARLRAQIDQLDNKLIELISARAKCASEVGTYKRQNNQDDCQFYRPEREAAILRKVAELNPGPLPNEEMARLIREIMSACLAIEAQQSIAFLGPPGTFTEEAALKHFGHSVKTSAMNSIGEVFREVESGAAHFGVVPIENSTEGIVTHTLDNFARSPLKIVGEVELRIHHHLLSQEADLKNISLIQSHQQSLAQCRKWLDSNMPGIAVEAVASNAQAAMNARETRGLAAVASHSAADKYRLNVLAKNIEDMPENTTRFLIIGSNIVAPSGVDKTSLLVTAPNRPGALYHLLQPFAKHNVSLTRIESRPSRGVNWEYIFFLDLEGHIEDMPLKNALDELAEVSDLVNILGSYPKAIL